MLNNRTSLLWMVELGAVDLHVWPSRCDCPECPDYVLFDIDAGPNAPAVDAAHRVREALDLLEFDSYLRTSGGDGLHVLVPIARRHTHWEARSFANVVAGALRLKKAKIVRPLPHARSRRRSAGTS